MERDGFRLSTWLLKNEPSIKKNKEVRKYDLSMSLTNTRLIPRYS